MASKKPFGTNGCRSVAIERAAFCFLAKAFVEIDCGAGHGDVRRRQLAGELVDDQGPIVRGEADAYRLKRLAVPVAN